MISIIIPVYNTPPGHMDRCLKSILKENYKDVEILLINDGSDDIPCVEYLKSIQISNIHVYMCPRKGVSAARNFGIRKAKGEYIAFVDADDEIINGFLHKASALVLQYNLDIVFGSIKYIPDTKHIGIQGSAEFLVLQEEELLEVKKSILEKKTNIFPYPILGSPCARLYRTAICKKIEFNEKIQICEDQIFNLYALEKSIRVGIYPAYWYNYYQNSFSAMHNLKGRQDFFLFYKSLKLYADKYGNAEIRKWIDIRLLGYMSGFIKQISCSKYTLHEKLKKIKTVSNIPLLNQTIKKLKCYDKELNIWKKIELLFWKCIICFRMPNS